MRDRSEQEVKIIIMEKKEEKEKGKHTQSLSEAALKCLHIFATNKKKMHVRIYKHDAKQDITSAREKKRSWMYKW